MWSFKESNLAGNNNQINSPLPLDQGITLPATVPTVDMCDAVAVKREGVVGEGRGDHENLY